MGSTSIEIPSGGINIKGYDFNISGLISSEPNYIMFTSPVGGSGDIIWVDFKIEVTGVSSQVLDVNGSTGNEAFEIARINFNGCSSLGEIDTYRQGLETGTGRFGGTPNLVLSGFWSGGYFIDNSIVRGLTDGFYSLYEEGTSFIMNSRFRSNHNADLNLNISFVDFSGLNFLNENTLQLDGCIITRNGISNASDMTIIPNITKEELPSRWKNNVGLPNTFVGGQLSITSEVTTIISASGVFEDVAGTYVDSDLQHFDTPSNGQLRHIGDSPNEFKVIVTGVFDCSPNQEM